MGTGQRGGRGKGFLLPLADRLHLDYAVMPRSENGLAWVAEHIAENHPVIVRWNNHFGVVAAWPDPACPEVEDVVIANSNCGIRGSAASSVPYAWDVWDTLWDQRLQTIAMLSRG